MFYVGEILLVFDFISLLGCEDLLPPVMKTNSHCKKLKQSCPKLKNKCAETLSAAIGNSGNAKQCKEALNEMGRENVGMLCANTCGTCGKFDLKTFISFLSCFKLFYEL